MLLPMCMWLETTTPPHNWNVCITLLANIKQKHNRNSKWAWQDYYYNPIYKSSRENVGKTLFFIDGEERARERVWIDWFNISQQVW